MAKVSAEATDLRSARKEHKRKKLLKRLIIVFVILAFAAVVFALRGLWLPKLKGIFDKPHGLIVNDGKLAEGNFPLALSDNGKAKLYTCDEYFVSVDDSAVKFYDIQGNLINTVQHTLAHPSACVSGKKMLVFENGGNSFELISVKGEIFKKKLDDTLLLAEFEDDMIAVVTSTVKYDSCLTVYDDEGSEIYKWASNKRIMSVDISDDGDGCFISTFTSENGQMHSTITELDFSSEGEAMVSKELDTLVLSVQKNASNDIWAIGDTAVYKLDKTGDIISHVEYKGELCAYTSNERVCAVAVSSVRKGTSRLMIWDSDDSGLEDRSESVSGKVKALVCNDDNVFMLSEHSAECYDFDLQMTATAAVSNDYVDFVYIEDSLIFIGYRDINKIEFKN